MIEYIQHEHDRKNIYFDVRLRSNSSMSQESFKKLMIFVACVSAFVSMILFLSGAWPVVGFLGLDVLLIYLAFKTSFQRHQHRYERIILDHDALVLEAHSKRGIQSRSIEPAFLQVRLEQEGGNNTLRLYSKGKFNEVGSYLGLTEKEQLAKDLRQALRIREKALVSTA